MSPLDVWVPYTVLFMLCLYLAWLNIKKSRAIKRLTGVWPSFGLDELTAIVNETGQRFKQAYASEQLLFVIKAVVSRLNLTDDVQNGIIHSKGSMQEALNTYADQCADTLQKLKSETLAAPQRRSLELRLRELQSREEDVVRGLARLPMWENFWNSIKL